MGLNRIGNTGAQRRSGRPVDPTGSPARLRILSRTAAGKGGTSPSLAAWYPDMQSGFLQQVAVSACGHGASIPDQPAHAGPQRVRGTAPVLDDPGLPKQSCGNFAVARAVCERVVHPEHAEPAGGLRFGGIERWSEASMLAERQKSPERQKVAARGCKPMKCVVQMHGALAGQLSFSHIKADMVPAIGQNSMFTAVGANDACEPRGKMLEEETVGIVRFRWPDMDHQRARIQRCVQKDTGVRSSSDRVFRENISPMRWGWRLGSRCSPACARRHRRDHAGAIPT